MWKLSIYFGNGPGILPLHPSVLEPCDRFEPRLPLPRVGVPLLLLLRLLAHSLPLEALEAILLLLLLLLHAALGLAHSHVHLTNVHAARTSRSHGRRAARTHRVEASLSSVRSSMVRSRRQASGSVVCTHIGGDRRRSHVRGVVAGKHIERSSTRRLEKQQRYTNQSRHSIRRTRQKH